MDKTLIPTRFYYIMTLKKSFFFLGILLFCGLQIAAQNTAMTYNIRYNNPNDGDNWWDNRKDDVVKLLQYYQPDFFGTQEGLLGQLTFIDAQLKDYNYVGVGRDDGKQKGEFTAIFYNTQKFELIKTETFWLSETPDKVSVGWDASMERICTYGAFKNMENKAIVHVFNGHFDHIGPEARKSSAMVIEQKINQLKILEEPIIVMGDFNCGEKDEPIQVFKSFLDDAISNSPNGLYGPPGTFNGFDENMVPQNRIDYIFTKNIGTIINYRHINDKRNNGLCVSDHLPVLVEFEID